MLHMLPLHSQPRHHCPAFGSTFRTDTQLQQRHHCWSARQQRRRLTVQNALSRAGKEAAVEKLTKAFEESTVVFGIRFKGIDVRLLKAVKKLQNFRKSLPQEGTSMYVVKNNLLKIAADKVDGWSELKQAAKEDNAWIFASEETAASCVKAFLDFEKKLKADIPKEQRLMAKPTDISGGVLEGQFLDYSAVVKLENMPTKLELIRDLAVMVKKVPTRVAVSIKAVPTKLARAISLLAAGDENQELKVGDVFPKAATDASS